jgi:hypothetical protein
MDLRLRLIDIIVLLESIGRGILEDLEQFCLILLALKYKFVRCVLVCFDFLSDRVISKIIGVAGLHQRTSIRSHMDLTASKSAPVATPVPNSVLPITRQGQEEGEEVL